jgi:hypothetical protein
MTETNSERPRKERDMARRRRAGIGPHAIPNERGKFTPNRYRIDDDNAYIELTDRQGQTVAVALVSAEDLPRVLTAGRWHRSKRTTEGLNYCGRSYRSEGKARLQWLHRFIMGEPAGVIDHINGDGLDNRRENLRVVTQAENAANRYRTRAKSGVVGVHWDKGKRDGGGKYFVLTDKANQKRKYFATVEEAKDYLESIKATL